MRDLGEYRPAAMCVRTREEKISIKQQPSCCCVADVRTSRHDQRFAVDAQNHIAGDVDLGPSHIRQMRPHDAIEVCGFDRVGVDQEEFVGAQVSQLLDHERPSPTQADYRNSHLTQPLLTQGPKSEDLAVKPGVATVAAICAGAVKDDLRSDLHYICRVLNAVGREDRAVNRARRNDDSSVWHPRYAPHERG